MRSKDSDQWTALKSRQSTFFITVILFTFQELEGILEELDEDGSGSMDFDEFCEMMMTKPEGEA